MTPRKDATAEVTLDVQRFHPGRDEAPWTATYSVDAGRRDTVFDALCRVQGQDPTLALRGTCRSAVCGGCAVNINGRPRLACRVLLQDAVAEAAGDPVRIAPLPRFPVLKDLVVDIDPFLATLQKAHAWLVTRPDHDGVVDPAASRPAEVAATCVLCGICDSVLAEESAEGAPTPAALVKTYRFAVDPRDALGAARRLEIIGDIGLLPEGFADRLARICPKGIGLDLTRLHPGEPDSPAPGSSDLRY